MTPFFLPPGAAVFAVPLALLPRVPGAVRASAALAGLVAP